MVSMMCSNEIKYISPKAFFFFFSFFFTREDKVIKKKQLYKNKSKERKMAYTLLVLKKIK